MRKHNKPHNNKPPSGRTNFASCIVATVFLIFVIIVILIVYFTVFKPKDVDLIVNAIQLPTFSMANGTVNFTFSQYVTAVNPNRAEFSHYDSSLQLLYAGSQVGFMFIPAGKIAAGRSQYMAATFSVQSFPLSASANQPLTVGGGPTVTDGLGGIRVGPTMEIESRLEMAGRVRILHFFSYHVDASADCRVAISAPRLSFASSPSSRSGEAQAPKGREKIEVKWLGHPIGQGTRVKGPRVQVQP